MGTLIAWLSKALQWLLDVLLWVPQKLYGLVLDGLAAVFEWIPVPDFLANAASWFAGIPPGVMYFAQALQVPTGVTIVVLAYVLRFCIRRIPIVG